VATTTVLSHLALPGVRNRFEWDRTAFREVIQFGKWMFVSSILGFLASNGDRLLLGGFVNSTVLGVYVIAFLIFASLEQLISRIVIDVSFPAFSEVARERRSALKKSYYRFHAPVACFAYASAGALIICGHTLISILYDPRYAEAGWILETLAFALATAPFRLAGHCLVAIGLPKLLSHLIAIRVVSLFVLLPLGFHMFGIPGAVWAIVLSYFASVPMTIYYMIRNGLFDLRSELRAAPAWFAGMLVAAGFNALVAYWL
jgi:O-antigen/teichoic acid export membrane protein